MQDLADAAEVLLAVVVGDLEHGALCPFDELARRRLVPVDVGLDLVGGGEQPAQEGAVADDLRVLAQVADGRHGRGEGVDLRLAAGGVEPAARAQVLGDGEDVDRLARREEGEHRLVDLAVTLPVEVLDLEPLLDHERVMRAIGEEHRSEDGLLGLDRVRRSDAGRGALRAVRAASVGGLGSAHRVGSERSNGGGRQPRASPHTGRLSSHACAQSSHVRRAAGASTKKASRRRPSARRDAGARYCSLTIVLTLAVTPSAISTTTM